MGIIAIAANPASGRDIRRLVSSATVFNNREKQNIIERMILSASAFGKHDFWIMPESYHFAERIRDHLCGDCHMISEKAIITPYLTYTNDQKDTIKFAEYAQKNGADVLIVLGGDGTSRAAAKNITDLPLIAISTGTNNVFPDVIEGTVVGMAAAAIASKMVSKKEGFDVCKRIEIRKNGVLCDIALIDVVFSDYEYAGAKAIWNKEDIGRVIVTQCHPASIGFSSIPGSYMIVGPSDDFGVLAECGTGDACMKVALAAGSISPICIGRTEKIDLDQPIEYTMENAGILALDGERELAYRAGDKLKLTIRRNGPLRADVRRILENVPRIFYALSDKEGCV